MLELALHPPKEFVSVKTIAKNQNISEKYLEQIITLLSRAGYVKSVRGPSGGYMLTQEPSYYTAGMILRLTEGDLAPVACLSDEADGCDRYDRCATVELWKRLSTAISEVVDSVTLADLVKIQDEK